jgi:hypothetical protein
VFDCFFTGIRIQVHIKQRLAIKADLNDQEELNERLTNKQKCH